MNESAKLRTNVVKNRYTFRVKFLDREDEKITVEAESFPAARLQLPEDFFYAYLLKWEATK
nr:MAG TPA: hypothetical protein [Caudoviricetes sp.]